MSGILREINLSIKLGMKRNSVNAHFHFISIKQEKNIYKKK